VLGDGGAEGGHDGGSGDGFVGGDRLGKTIIFAKNQRHADFIYERFIANYPHLDNGNFARVITHSVECRQCGGCRRPHL
jgi:type I site-specific restriction endonuclease